MELYGGNEIKLSLLEKILRSSSDEQLISMNLATTLNVKLAILKEYSYRNFGLFNSLTDNEILLKCCSDSQLERSLALRVASFRNIV